jgi:hypothetical protein
MEVVEKHKTMIVCLLDGWYSDTAKSLAQTGELEEMEKWLGHDLFVNAIMSDSKKETSQCLRKGYQNLSRTNLKLKWSPKIDPSLTPVCFSSNKENESMGMQYLEVNNNNKAHRSSCSIFGLQLYSNGGLS